jgi:hypothetical protein
MKVARRDRPSDAVGALMAVVVLAVACGGSDAVTRSGQTTAGIVGTTAITRGCPAVSSVTACPQRPLSANLVVTSADGRDVVARSRSSADGSFRMELPAGTYLLSASNLAGDPLPRAQPQAVEVLDGRFTRVLVEFDSGVR